MKRRSFFKFFSLLIPLFNIRVLAHESNEDVLFNHGVASGDPTHDKVIIWSKITKDTNKKIKEKGAHFFVTFPPYSISDYDTWITDDLLNFYKDTSIKLIGEPNSFVLNDTLFSNHPYHTILEGRRLRTEIFIKNARKELDAIIQ